MYQNTKNNANLRSPNSKQDEIRKNAYLAEYIGDFHTLKYHVIILYRHCMVRGCTEDISRCFIDGVYGYLLNLFHCLGDEGWAIGAPHRAHL